MRHKNQAMQQFIECIEGNGTLVFYGPIMILKIRTKLSNNFLRTTKKARKHSPETQAQNGVTDRYNRTAVETARILLNE